MEVAESDDDIDTVQPQVEAEDGPGELSQLLIEEVPSELTIYK